MFIKDLLTTLVGAEYRPRGNYHIKEMVEYCKNREYTHLIIVAEWRKELRKCRLLLVFPRVVLPLSRCVDCAMQSFSCVRLVNLCV